MPDKPPHNRRGLIRGKRHIPTVFPRRGAFIANYYAENTYLSANAAVEHFLRCFGTAGVSARNLQRKMPLNKRKPK
ncbi:MAG TPA: hypothetical protein DEA22_14940 [Blastocatellia bacterium]|nr:hypothetical protein [Blastocatellia bacterium]